MREVYPRMTRITRIGNGKAKEVNDCEDDDEDEEEDDDEQGGDPPGKSLHCYNVGKTEGFLRS